MRIVLQRVASASVQVEGDPIASIGRGLLLLVGVEPKDVTLTAQRAADQIAKLRLFDDVDGRMNLTLAQVGGAVLLVSQFTLAASLRKGNRPSFHTAAAPSQAAALCVVSREALEKNDLVVFTGRFGETMQAASINDGPATPSVSDSCGARA